MTYKEYIETFDKKRRELEEEQQIARVKCMECLNEKVKDYIGKKVRYDWHEDIAYFGGFDFGHNLSIEPTFFKVKKDGSQSLQSAGFWAYDRENDDIISKLEIVNE